MASDTVPAVPPPPPHDPTVGATGTGTPNQPAAAGGGWFAGALAAVDPARPTFDLTPTAADNPDGAAAALSTGGSSADFHNDGTTSTDSGTGTSTGGQDKGVLRAFAHAAIERWRQGGQARLKALDIQKEKAKALQVKEARTSTVNRSEKLVGGNTGTNTSNQASKGSDTKTSAVKKDHASGGKANHAGAGGRSGPAGHGHGGSGAGRGHGTGGTGKQHGGRTDTKNAPSKSGTGAAGSKNGPAGSSGSGAGAGKPGAQGNAGKPGKDGKTPTGGTSNGTSGTAGSTKPTSSSGKDHKPPVKTFPQDTTTQRPWKKKPDTTNPKNPGQSGGSGGAGGTNTPPKPATGTGRPDLTKTPDPAKPDPKTTPAQAPAPGGTSVNTQSSREAGYRDGTRAGKAAAHVQAYKDGWKDGKADAKQAAARDKKRLDQARAQRQQQPAPAPAKKQIPPRPTIPPKPTTPPPAPDPRTLLMKTKEPTVATPAPAPTGPTPVHVDHVDATHLRLGEGANRQYISRGEVRTLKQYERLLRDKANRMTRIADGTKALQAHAEEQAKQVTKLREQAKAVKGGEKLVASLTRLEEAALNQARKAADIHKRAVRAAENTRVLLSNVETRYGGMYRAVVNSDETAPAEMSFYKEGATAHA